jgi:hypothetical protein
MLKAKLTISRPVFVRVGQEEWDTTGDRVDVEVEATGEVVLAHDDVVEDAVHIREIKVDGRKESLVWMSKADREEIECALIDVACGRT